MPSNVFKNIITNVEDDRKQPRIDCSPMFAHLCVIMSLIKINIGYLDFTTHAWSYWKCQQLINNFLLGLPDFNTKLTLPLVGYCFLNSLVAHTFKSLLDCKFHCEEKDCGKIEQQTVLQRVLIYTSATLTLNNSWHNTIKVKLLFSKVC